MMHDFILVAAAFVYALVTVRAWRVTVDARERSGCESEPFLIGFVSLIWPFMVLMIGCSALLTGNVGIFDTAYRSGTHS